MAKSKCHSTACGTDRWNDSPHKPGAAAPNMEHFSPGEMLKTWQFYVWWFMYACGAGAGLMIISKLAKMVDVQAGVKLGFVLVAVLAVGNGAGRVIAGTLSDKIGRKATLFICFVFQEVCILLLSRASAENALGGTLVMALLSALIGANYGANLALFPSYTKDLWGLKSFGVNYGILFTAWGVGGLVLPRLQQTLTAQSGGSYQSSFITAGVLLLVGAGLTLLLKSRSASTAVTAPAGETKLTSPAKGGVA